MRMTAISEDAFQRQVIDLAHLRRWRVAHFRKVKTIRRGKPVWMTAVAADGAGFCDLVLARRGVVLFRELKTDRGVTSEEQAKWLTELGSFGDVWRPRDWQRIERELL